MTIIAWDGTTLAADKQSTCVGHPSTVTKIFTVPGGIVGLSGGASHAMAMLTWFENGRVGQEWPEPRDKDNAADCMFVDPHGNVLIYSGTAGPNPERYEDKHAAMGCGRDYALAAMYLGKTAREAVDVACALDVNCGMGIDTLELK